MFLEEQLEKLKSYRGLYDRINHNISQASVGWHIEHSLIVIHDIMQQVIDSDAKFYRWTFNIGRFFVGSGPEQDNQYT